MRKCEKLLQIAFCLDKNTELPVFLAGLLWELAVAKAKFSTHSLKTRYINSAVLGDVRP